MRFNSIVSTFVLSFTSITNALPMNSAAHSQDPSSSTFEWSESEIINRGGFRVVRASSRYGLGQLTVPNLIIEQFIKKDHPTWKAHYESELIKWSTAPKTKYIVYHSIGENRPDAFIVLDNRVPKLDSLFTVSEIDLCIRVSLERRKKDCHCDELRWKQLMEYAKASPHEFIWTKRKGWTATPIFSLDQMLHDATAEGHNTRHSTEDVTGATTLLQFHYCKRPNPSLNVR
ncbi:hypothetical protein APHAL10511_005509 [Amanita phalloides]|nr:hypothetical protein APHAL10511_005509 [Amanita phalloides]